MTATARFFLYLLLCLLLAALIYPPLVDLFPAAGAIEAHRALGRLTQVLAIAGIFWFLRAQGLANRFDLGYGVGRRTFAVAVARGWLAGVLILGVLMAALLWSGVRVLDRPEEGWPVYWLSLLLARSLLAGLLIALIEETFFRGALQSAISRDQGVLAATLLPSLLYAVLHFIKPQPMPVAPEWHGSLALAWSSFPNLLRPEHLDSLVALLLAGLLLSLLRRQCGHIGYGIGMHAGWVFVIQTAKRLTDGNPQADLYRLTGNYDGVIGWGAAIWLALCIASYLLFLYRRGDFRNA
jgi:membrane protease YdiL (CAAX protease family)